MALSSDMECFATYVAMAYHEARNVRHLVMGGALDVGPYRPLITGMAKNRDAAWKDLQSVRKKAQHAKSAGEAEEIFRHKFKIGLDDLVELSENAQWRGYAFGGNKWADIGKMLIALRIAIDSKDIIAAKELLDKLPDMQHNTGVLREKLLRLESSLDCE